MKKRRRWLLFSALAVAFLLVLFSGKSGSIRRVTLLVTLRGEALSRAAEAALSPGEGVKTRDLLGTRRHYNVWPVGPDASAQMVQFSVGANGFGSETSYWGIYTTTDGQPAGWPEPDMPLVPEGDGFFWQEENGDNTYYTEKINDVWWYYRATF